MTIGGRPPLVIGLGPEAARQQAAARGWQVKEIARTAPPSRALAGAERVIRQRVIAPGLLALVVAASIELAGPCSRRTPG